MNQRALKERNLLHRIPMKFLQTKGGEFSACFNKYLKSPFFYGVVISVQQVILVWYVLSRKLFYKS
uniref:Uncharacterized protein n=1 Tax=Hordeum vulgare subsp. vulgare TaxID=112509 RepID=A0A8I6XL33_HORVV